MGKYFGTDGFRGKANVVITAEHAFKIGRFLGVHLNSVKKVGRRAKVVVGQDTRRSSKMLFSALSAGLTASGVDVYDLGVTSTPCVGYCVNKGSFNLGIMVSASHNPYFDNGLKILNDKGEKAGEELINLIEEYLDKNVELPYATDRKIGVIKNYVKGKRDYINFLISLTPNLTGKTVALDTANGGSYEIAEEVFSASGATVKVFSNNPSGSNINKKCGATYTAKMCNFIKKTGADVGFCFDGDADRCMAVDEKGKLVDGDAMLYVLASDYKNQNKLKKNTVATTVMSNIGLKRSLAKKGVRVEETVVGDIFVYERMKNLKLSLGGEAAGHIIFSGLSTTGDGVLTAVMLSRVMEKEAKSLSVLTEGFKRYPQVTVNLPVNDKNAVMASDEISRAIQEVEAKLVHGRLLVRASGTEPVIRITAEAPSKSECKKSVEAVKSAIVNIFG